MRKDRIVLIIIVLVFVLALFQAPAAADNDITVLKPYLSGGAYGMARGQIDTPVSIKVDANDNVYVLQHVHIYGSKFKSAINVYDRNLTLLRSFDVLKTSMADVGWDRAQGKFYYDNLANAFDVDANGTVYVLCGWDVVVLASNGTYQYQFPVSAFMGWIGQTSNETEFYYPHGLIVTNDGYVVITSGKTPEKHEIIFIYPDGRLYKKIEVPKGDMYDLFKDRNGSLYVTEAGSNVVRIYSPNITSETDVPMYFNGTYNGNPAALAFMADGNMTASANGIFVYNKSGAMIAHFMDNNLSANDANWGRPVAVNASDWLVVASGMQDSKRTPQPLMMYEYGGGVVTGEQKKEEYDICAGALGAFGLAALLYFCVRRS